MEKITAPKAAKLLGISLYNLSKLEKQGILHPIRNKQGVRFYLQEEIAGIKSRSSPTIAEEAAQVNIGIQRDLVTKVSLSTRALLFIGGVFSGYVLLVVLIAILFIISPLQTAIALGYIQKTSENFPSEKVTYSNVLAISTIANKPKSVSLIRVIAQPISDVSLNIVKLVSPQAYAEVSKSTILDPNNVFTINNNETITPELPIKIPNNSSLQISNPTQIDNLNSQFLQGKQPGTKVGDIAIVGETTAPQTIIVNQPAPVTNQVITSSTTGLTNANLSGSAGISNDNLANSTVTINTTSPLSGGGSLSLGGNITLNCSGCGGGSSTFTPTSIDTLTNKTIDAASNTLSGLSASNLAAGDYSSVLTSGTYSINITGTVASAVNFTGTLAGDITGNQTSTIVSKLNGVPFSFGTLASGNLMQYNGTNWINVTPASLGSIALASGTTGTDVNISGSPAALGGTLTLNIPDAGNTSRGLITTGTQSIAGAKTFTSDFTLPANFITPFATNYATTGVQDNVNLGSGSTFRYTGVSGATFTGLSGGVDGRFIRITNTSSSNLTISNQSLSSLAVNRIITETGADVVISSDASLELIYDASISRWRVSVLPVAAITNPFTQNGNSFGANAILGTTDAFGLDLITGGSTRFTLATGSATLTGNGVTTISSNNSLSLISAAGAALNITSGTTGALNIDSGTTGDINLGAGNSAKIINLGTGIAGDTINIGTNNTTADTISIGSALDAFSLGSTGLNVTTGGALTGVASIDTIAFSPTAMTFAGAGTLSTTGANALTLDSGTTGAINLGIGSNAKTITIGNTTGATALNLNTGSGGLSINGNTTITGSNTLTTGTGVTTINGSSVVLAGNNASFDMTGTGVLGVNITNNRPITFGTGTLTVPGSFATPNGADYTTTGTQNDVNLGSGTVFRYTGAGTATFTGFAGGVDGRQIRIVNTSSSNFIVTNQDAGSLAANRIILSSLSSLTIAPNAAVAFQYDSVASRWRLIGLPATPAVIGTFAFLQGGNGFGTTATLGTTDAFGLNLITTGNTRFNLSASSATLTGTGNTTITSDSSVALTSAASSGITLTSGTGAQTFTSSVVTGTTTTSAFVFNASALTSGTAFRLTSTGTSGLLFDQNATNTNGTIDNLSYGAATSLSGTTTGLNLDLNTNLTATGISLTGLSLATAADTNINTATKKGLNITSGTITQNTAAATGTYVGLDITMPALTLTSGTAFNAYGLRVTTDGLTQTAGTLTSNGLLVDSTSSTITTGGTLNGLKISAPTTIPSVGSYNSINLGTSTSSTANSYDQATIAVGNLTSTAQQNFSTLNIQNGGTGYLDMELIRGFINFQGMNQLYDDFTSRILDVTNTWTSTVTGAGSACSILSGGLNGLLRMTTGNAANRGCELTTQAIGTLTNGYYQRGNNPIFETKLKIDTLTNARIFAGFTNTRVAVAAETNPSTHHAYIVKRAADTVWQCVTDDGGATETTTSTGVTIVANTFYRLRVELRNGATPETICTVDNGITVTRTVVTATQPGATNPMDVYVRDNQSDAVVKNMDVDYVRAWQDDPPAIAVNSEGNIATGAVNGTANDQISNSPSATLLPKNDVAATDSGEVNPITDVINKLFKVLVEFFGKVIFHEDVTFLGRPTFNKDTAGHVVIKKDESEVEVKFAKEYTHIPVVTTSINLTGDINSEDLPKYAIYDIDTYGFKIKLSKSAGLDLEFSWIALAVNEDEVLISPTLIPPISPTIIPTPTPTDIPVASQSAQSFPE